jgi:hypothetical protein
MQQSTAHPAGRAATSAQTAEHEKSQQPDVTIAVAAVIVFGYLTVVSIVVTGILVVNGLRAMFSAFTGYPG